MQTVSVAVVTNSAPLNESQVRSTGTVSARSTDRVHGLDLDMP